MAESEKNKGSWTGALLGAAAGGGLALLLSRFTGGGGFLSILFGLGGVAGGALLGDYISGNNKLISQVSGWMGIKPPPETDRPNITREKAEEDFLCGMYLQRYPGVLNEIESGKCKTAREHYENFGKKMGYAFTREEWVAQGKPLPAPGSTKQRCDLSHVSATTALRQPTNDDFVDGVFKNNRVLYHGDAKHEDPAILKYLNDSVAAWKRNKVKHVFLELDREHNAALEQYYLDGKEIHLGKIMSKYESGLAYRDLIVKCKEAGIRVHCMDKRPTDDRVIAAASNRDAFRKAYGAKHGMEAADAVIQLADAQRFMDTEDWVTFVNGIMNGTDEKAVIVAGTHHQDNLLGMPDGDERVAEVLNCNVVYAVLQPGTDMHRQSIKFARVADHDPKLPKPVYEETPDMLIDLPAAHIGLAQSCRRQAGTSRSPEDLMEIDKQCAAMLSDGDKMRQLMRQNFQHYRAAGGKLGDNPLADPWRRNREGFYELTKSNTAKPGELIKDADITKALAEYREMEQGMLNAYKGKTVPPDVQEMMTLARTLIARGEGLERAIKGPAPAKLPADAMDAAMDAVKGKGAPVDGPATYGPLPPVPVDLSVVRGASK